MSKASNPADVAADAMGESLEVVMEFAVSRGYCPACFAVALAKSILAFDEAGRFEHLDYLKTLEVRKVIFGSEGNA